MSQRVYLHVGVPKSGTTFLQASLDENKKALKEAGVLYPSGHLGSDAGHLDAVLDVLDLAAPGGRTTTGAWDRLTQAARDWRRGTVLVSPELLAYHELDLCAPGEQARLLADGTVALGGTRPGNPSGGLLSKGEPLGASGLGQVVELVHQLRGEAGARQVAGARVGLAHTVGRGANASCVIVTR